MASECGAIYSIVVDWYGPFSSPDAAVKWVKENEALVPGKNSVPREPQASDNRLPSGLYFSVGKSRLLGFEDILRWFFQSSKLQYVGVGNVVNRLSKKGHPIRVYMSGKQQIWVGALATFPLRDDVPRVVPKHDNLIEMAEALLAFFMSAPINQRKREFKSPDPGVLVNRWHHVSPAGELMPVCGSPHRTVPDVIVWPYATKPRPQVMRLARRTVVEHPVCVTAWPEQEPHAAIIRITGKQGKSLRAQGSLSQASRVPQFSG